MGKIKGFILNRRQYDKIRKMDHCQMTMWAESVYKSGYKDGKETAEADSLISVPSHIPLLLQSRTTSDNRAG